MRAAVEGYNKADQEIFDLYAQHPGEVEATLHMLQDFKDGDIEVVVHWQGMEALHLVEMLNPAEVKIAKQGIQFELLDMGRLFQVMIVLVYTYVCTYLCMRAHKFSPLAPILCFDWQHTNPQALRLMCRSVKKQLQQHKQRQWRQAGHRGKCKEVTEKYSVDCTLWGAMQICCPGIMPS